MARRKGLRVTPRGETSAVSAASMAARSGDRAKPRAAGAGMAMARPRAETVESLGRAELQHFQWGEAEREM
ncbi:MAG: hypothetical protein C0504_02650 [Candidatus Solibacter sp.]|nr:hypothetical protein [Candidatus Solibacter sp.]